MTKYINIKLEVSTHKHLSHRRELRGYLRVHSNGGGVPLRPKNKWVVSAHGGMSVSWNTPHRHARVALDGHARPCAGLRVGPGLPAAEPACVGV